MLEAPVTIYGYKCSAMEAILLNCIPFQVTYLQLSMVLDFLLNTIHLIHCIGADKQFQFSCKYNSFRNLVWVFYLLKSCHLQTKVDKYSFVAYLLAIPSKCDGHRIIMMRSAGISAVKPYMNCELP